MGSMKTYMVRDKAQQTRRVQLHDPATGNPTDDYIEVRSSYSDAFIEARDRAMGELTDYFEPDKEKRKEFIRDRQLRLKASLVAGWSFEEAPTEDNIVEFLRGAPQVENLVMQVADDHAGFFGGPSDGSGNGPKKR